MESCGSCSVDNNLGPEQVRADDAAGVERTYALLLLPGRTSCWSELLAREGVSSSVRMEDCPVHFIPSARRYSSRLPRESGYN